MASRLGLVLGVGMLTLASGAGPFPAPTQRYFVGSWLTKASQQNGESLIYSAVEPVASRRHTPDAGLRARAGTQPVRWRIVALSSEFVEIGATPWTGFQFK